VASLCDRTATDCPQAMISLKYGLDLYFILFFCGKFHFLLLTGWLERSTESVVVLQQFCYFSKILSVLLKVWHVASGCVFGPKLV
jgi:hypothetical protein